MTGTASPGSIGFGQQDPNDSSSDFNKTAFLVNQIVARLDTMKLVQVVAVHGGAGAVAAAGTVDVLPLVNQIDGQGNSTPQGTVFGLPWSRMQGGQNAVICDPQAGDIGWVVAADRDISSVKSTKAQANPGSFRKFNVADGVYAGGCINVAPNQYLVFTSAGVRLVDRNGNSVAMSSAGLVLTDSNGNVISMMAGGIAVTGNLTVTGSVIAGYGGPDQVGLQTHEHPGGVPPPTPGT